MIVATLVVMSCLLGDCHEYGVESWQGDDAPAVCIARLESLPDGVGHCVITADKGASQ